MDVEVSFPFTLIAKVRYRGRYQRLCSIEFNVPRKRDLHSFVYGLVNPFHHPDDWVINGENYHSTFFYREASPGEDCDFLGSHTMQKGLVMSDHPDKVTNAVLAPF